MFQSPQCKQMLMLDIELLPNQPKDSHFLVHFLLNQLGRYLLSYLKGIEQIEKQTEPHNEQSLYSLCHTIQAQKQTNPKMPYKCSKKKKIQLVRKVNMQRSSQLPQTSSVILLNDIGVYGRG